MMHWTHIRNLRHRSSSASSGVIIPVSSTTTPSGTDQESPTAPVLTDPPSSITTTGMTISWAASTDNVGVTGYQVYRNDVIFDTVGSSVLTYAFTGLTPGTSYRFFVKAIDAAGNISSPSNVVSSFTTQTDTTPPSDPVIASPADNITETSVTFHWAASTDNVGVTTYRIFRDGVQIGSQVASLLSYTATGLTASTQYAFTVKALDLAGNISNASNTLTVTTVDITAPSTPVIATPADTIAETSIAFHWTASTDNVGINHYSVFRGGSLIGTTNSSTTTYTDTGLTNNTQYAYTVKAFDAAGNASASSNTLTVTTLSSADVTPPTAPGSLTKDSQTDTTVDMHWTASTDAVGVTGYNVYTGGSLTATLGVVTSYQATGLTQNTSYAFTVKAFDAAGNLSAASNTLNVTTDTAVDTTPPSAPVIASPADIITQSSVTFHWAASTDDVGVANYFIYRGTSVDTGIGLGVNDASTLSFTATNLQSSHAYNFVVYAKDAAGNLSDVSNVLSVTTAAPPDTQAPTAPVLSSPPTNITQTGMTLSWSASSDNVGVTGYLVYRDGNLVQTLGMVTTYTASGLTAGTQYSWTVKATDLAGNLSAASNTVTATTAVPPAFQRAYGDTAAWNQLATGFATHSNSAALVAQMCMPQPGSTAINWNVDGFDSTDYTYPVYYVSNQTDTYTVSCTDGSANWNNQPIAFNPAWVPANNGGDRQMIIFDDNPNTGTGREWDFYNVTSIDTTGKIIHCTRCNVVPKNVDGSLSGGVADCRGPNGKVKGCVKFRGVGIQYLAMLVRPEEVNQGVIEHALSMPIPNPSCNIYYNPCTKAENYNDGSLSRCTPGTPTALTAISSLTHSGATATATVADTSGITNGGIIFIYGATDTLYNGVFNATVVNSTTFTYTMSGTPASNASGTLRYQVGGIPEGTRYRGTWTDADITTWLATINTRIINAGGSAATSAGIQKLARCIAIAMRDYGWIVSDHSGSHHIQCEINLSANQTRGRVKWTDMGIPASNTTYGSKIYPRDILDGLVTQNNVIAVEVSATYPANTGTG